MENIKIAVDAIIIAEEAVNKIVKSAKEEYEAKGKTMLEQVTNYIYDKLDEAGWMCRTFAIYDELCLGKQGTARYIFYINHCPVFYIQKNNIKMHYNSLDEFQMKTIACYWNKFKEEFDKNIKIALDERINALKREMNETQHTSELINSWKL